MSRSSNGLIALSNPASPNAETFRSVCTMLQHQFLSAGNGSGTVCLVTSPLDREGKTTTAANLAVTYAQLGKRVVLVDCNMKNPELDRWFHLSPDAGVLDYLLRSVEPKSLLHGTPIDNLEIIQAGRKAEDPADMWHFNGIERLLQDLKREYDLILLDAPPVLNYSDARMLADKCDAVILVVKYGKTKRSLVQQTKQILERNGAHIIGVIMNQVKG